MTPRARHYYIDATCPQCNNHREWWLPQMGAGDTATMERGRRQAAEWLQSHPCRRSA